LTIAPPDSDEVPRFGFLELELKTGIVPDNPFDPDEIDLRVEFTAPSGAKSETGAFWYQAFDSSGWTRIGEPGWRARFTPTEIGQWTAVAQIPPLRSGSDPSTSGPRVGQSRGFVRVHRTTRYLASTTEASSSRLVSTWAGGPELVTP
jgi:hypothetical protein